MRRVGIIDYGIGNLRSVANALKYVGADPFVTDDADSLLKCDQLIFPGVGAFGYGMDCLKKKRLDCVVKEAAHMEKPVLGICVGMQLLFESSTEFGKHQGLGLVSGNIDRLGTKENENAHFRLPNVGWAPISIASNLGGLAEKFLSGISVGSQFYFVHSYCAASDSPNTVATSKYAETSFTAVIAKGSIIGTQFHPEKSGPGGLRLLRNFIE